MDNAILAIACDHGGFELKQTLLPWLDDHGIRYTDLGCYHGESCDYPDMAHLVCEAIAGGRAGRGLLLCGTGLGMSIAANKHPGIRAACVSDTYSAKMARQHNDANVLCIGGRVLGSGLAAEILEIFLSTPFEEGGRHTKRVAKIMANEENWK